MKLYIFRHGQTKANKLNRVQTGYEELAQLDETGLKQAEELKDKLITAELPVIYASPFDRARQTGEIVAQANDSKLVVLDELQEYGFGEAEGLSEKEVMQKYGKEFSAVLDVSDLATYNIRLPNGESKAEALARFKDVLDFIKQDCQCDRAGVATHGHIMRLFYFDKFGIDHIFKNTEYFVVDI